MPVQAVERRLATLRIKYGGFPYHLALLQLEHDSSFQKHSPFDTMSDFLELVIDGFAEGAPRHHHLHLPKNKKRPQQQCPLLLPLPPHPGRRGSSWRKKGC